MDQMAESQKIERYLLRQMNELEESEFEAYYLPNNECIDQLEIAEKLLEGLRFAKTSNPLDNSVVSINPATRKAANDSHWWRKGLPVWASAAMLFIALLPSVMMYQELELQSRPNAELSVISLPLTETRSATQQMFIIPFSKQRIILSMFIDTELEQMQYPRYVFELTPISNPESNGGQSRTSSNSLMISDLKLDNNDMLYIDLGKSVVNPGSYRFALRGLTGHSEKQEISAGTVTFEL